MKTDNITRQNGFTLIEVLMAMAIFTIGILGLFGMQAAAIKENLAANAITTGSAWAMDRVEQLLSLDYDNSALLDGAGTTSGCGGLGDWPDADGVSLGTTVPVYNVYWNVAKDCTLTNIPNDSTTPENQIYRPKHLRIIVTSNNGSGEKEAAVFNYIKQNVIE
jgi:prepilin-type N-terminal cleavage/methylation domain-containing protein